MNTMLLKERYTSVLAAISKTGAARVPVEGLVVTSLIVRPWEGENETCDQCELELPFTPEAFEPYRQLRSYDMLAMADEAGWAPEPEKEVPGPTGTRYPMIPRFAAILEKHGDWIAHKMHLLLEKIAKTEDWFVVHPDEADSSAICDALQVPLNDKLIAVRVPRSFITAAQHGGDDWKDVVDQNAHELWVEQLAEISRTKAGGIILDIFRASDSTCRSIEALLTHFQICPLAYLSFVDFIPGSKTAGRGHIPKYSLYDWHNPRPVSKAGI